MLVLGDSQYLTGGTWDSVTNQDYNEVLQFKCLQYSRLV